MIDRAIRSAPPGITATDLHLVADRTSIELFGMGGEASDTMLQYIASPPDRVGLFIEDGVSLPELQVRSFCRD